MLGVSSTAQTPVVKYVDTHCFSRRRFITCVTYWVATESSASTESALSRSWSATSLWKAIGVHA